MSKLEIRNNGYYRNGTGRTILIHDLEPKYAHLREQGFEFGGDSYGVVYRRNGSASESIFQKEGEPNKYDLLFEENFPALVLEVGKLYRNRFGSIIEIVVTLKEGDEGYDAGYRFRDTGSGYYFENGFWNEYGLKVRPTLTHEVTSTPENPIKPTLLFGAQEAEIRFHANRQ